MKTTKQISVALAATVGAAALALPVWGQSTLGEGPEVKLKWVGGDTPQQRHHQVMLEWGTTTIPERSNGRVTFDMLTVADLNVTGAEIGRFVCHIVRHLIHSGTWRNRKGDRSSALIPHRDE